MSRDLYSRWDITQGMHVMGRATPAAYFAALRAYNTRTISGQITQDCRSSWGAEANADTCSVIATGLLNGQTALNSILNAIAAKCPLAPA